MRFPFSARIKNDPLTELGQLTKIQSAFPQNKKRLISQAFLIGGDEETRTPDPLHAKQ
jgi:hypothetical protein